MNNPVSFDWGISFGNAVQIVTVLIAVVGIYYGLVAEQKSNGKEIARNAADIEKLYSERTALINELRMVDDRREERFVRLLGELKTDVHYLVRSSSKKRIGDD